MNNKFCWPCINKYWKIQLNRRLVDLLNEMPHDPRLHFEIVVDYVTAGAGETSGWNTIRPRPTSLEETLYIVNPGLESLNSLIIPIQFLKSIYFRNSTRYITELHYFGIVINKYFSCLYYLRSLLLWSSKTKFEKFFVVFFWSPTRTFKYIDG